MNPISNAQLSANRLNAQLSTGPRTEAGKARTRLNSIRHGLTGLTVVLPHEDVTVFQNFSQEIVASLRPETPSERQIAQTIANTQWRLNRIQAIEDNLFALAHLEEAGDFDAETPEIHAAFTAARAFRTDCRSFATLSLYEQRLNRTLAQSYKLLNELQTERRKANPPAVADRPRETRTPQSNGSVCSTSEIRERKENEDPRRRLYLVRNAPQTQITPEKSGFAGAA